MSYFKIHNWMISLGLKGRELFLFGLIFSFYEKGRPFTGSYKYITSVTGIQGRNNISNGLKSLVNKGFLVKQKFPNGCSYLVNESSIETILDQYRNDTRVVSNRYTSSIESIPNTKVYKNNNNKYISTQLENELNYEYPSEEEISKIMSD